MERRYSYLISELRKVETFLSLIRDGERDTIELAGDGLEIVRNVRAMLEDMKD